MTLYQVLRTVFMPLTRFLWPTKVVNKENFYKMEGGLVICNHYSKADAIIPTATIFKKEIHVLAKHEAFDSAKIANWFLRKIGAIPIRRGEADIEAVKSVLQVLKNNKKLLIFPEGTRNKAGTKELSEFKQGTARFAIKAKKQILPMIYYKMPKLFRKNYLYLGEPFSLDDFYITRTLENYNNATQYIYDKMVETRQKCDEYVIGLKTRKKINDN